MSGAAMVTVNAEPPDDGIVVDGQRLALVRDEVREPGRRLELLRVARGRAAHRGLAALQRLRCGELVRDGSAVPDVAIADRQLAFDGFRRAEGRRESRRGALGLVRAARERVAAEESMGHGADVERRGAGARPSGHRDDGIHVHRRRGEDQGGLLAAVDRDDGRRSDAERSALEIHRRERREEDAAARSGPEARIEVQVRHLRDLLGVSRDVEDPQRNGLLAVGEGDGHLQVGVGNGGRWRGPRVRDLVVEVANRHVGRALTGHRAGLEHRSGGRVEVLIVAEDAQGVDALGIEVVRDEQRRLVHRAAPVEPPAADEGRPSPHGQPGVKRGQLRGGPDLRPVLPSTPITAKSNGTTFTVWDCNPYARRS